MKFALNISVLLLFFFGFACPEISGQELTCSCEAPDRKCQGTARCRSGCTAFCGTGDACYLSCRSVFLHAQVTKTFVKMKGTAIVAELEKLTRATIKFTPDKDKENKRYTLRLKKDYIWNVLEFLSHHGEVKLNGRDFGKLLLLRQEMRGGKRFGSVSFKQTRVKDAIATLSFLSGLKLTVESGNNEAAFSISLQDASLPEILSKIAEQTKVKLKLEWRFG